MIQNDVLGTAKLEGFTQGMAEGRAKGIEEGKEEGRKEGKEEGREERSIEIAKQMKIMNLSDRQISIATGLSTDIIDKL